MLIGVLVLTLPACGGGSAGAPQAPVPAPAEQTMVPAPIDSTLMLRTPSGLQFRDLAVGTGALVTPGSWVQVHYVGQLLNGTIFDANGPRDTPLRFQVGARRVIAGWDEGVNGMRVGGRRQLIIPPSLGYGPRGAGPIPPNATLVFLIEVVQVN